jgi:hypothetical protein
MRPLRPIIVFCYLNLPYPAGVERENEDRRTSDTWCTAHRPSDTLCFLVGRLGGFELQPSGLIQSK